jgi:hypothetical protein
LTLAELDQGCEGSDVERNDYAEGDLQRPPLQGKVSFTVVDVCERQMRHEDGDD